MNGVTKMTGKSSGRFIFIMVSALLILACGISSFFIGKSSVKKTPLAENGGKAESSPDDNARNSIFEYCGLSLYEVRNILGEDYKVDYYEGAVIVCNSSKCKYGFVFQNKTKETLQDDSVANCIVALKDAEIYNGVKMGDSLKNLEAELNVTAKEYFDEMNDVTVFTINYGSYVVSIKTSDQTAEGTITSLQLSRST